MLNVVGTMFFKDGKLLINKLRKRPTFQMVDGAVEEGELEISSEIEKFMWFGIDDDMNLLSNTLKNEVVPYCIENKLIFSKENKLK